MELVSSNKNKIWLRQPEHLCGATEHPVQLCSRVIILEIWEYLSLTFSCLKTSALSDLIRELFGTKCINYPNQNKTLKITFISILLIPFSVAENECRFWKSGSLHPSDFKSSYNDCDSWLQKKLHEMQKSRLKFCICCGNDLKIWSLWSFSTKRTSKGHWLTSPGKCFPGYRGSGTLWSNFILVK